MASRWRDHQKSWPCAARTKIANDTTVASTVLMLLQMRRIPRFPALSACIIFAPPPGVLSLALEFVPVLTLRAHPTFSRSPHTCTLATAQYTAFMCDSAEKSGHGIVPGRRKSTTPLFFFPRHADIAGILSPTIISAPTITSAFHQIHEISFILLYTYKPLHHTFVCEVE